MLQNDELLERIGYLERANRFWKGLTFGLGAALFLFLALGSVLGFSLYFQATDRQANVEAAMREAEAAMREADVARQRAAEALKEQLKAQDKNPW